MEIAKRKLSQYRCCGYSFLRGCFSQVEIDTVLRELPAIFSQDQPGRILEKGSKIVRSIYGAHTSNRVLHCLANQQRIVHTATKILGGDVYIHQFKINVKAAFNGDIWPWHQDFIYWMHEDGMLQPQATTAAIFLDEVNEFNGPLLLVPCSHRAGVIEGPARGGAALTGMVGADLKYTVPPDCVAKLVSEHGIVAPKGPAGSVLFFHCNLVHGSAPNMSPFDRRIVYVTFNSVGNRLAPQSDPRPDFLASRNFEPISAVSETALQSWETQRTS